VSAQSVFSAFQFSSIKRSYSKGNRDSDEDDSLSKQTSLGPLGAFVNLQVAMRIC
jgi:hypothetical protein